MTSSRARPDRSARRLASSWRVLGCVVIASVLPLWVGCSSASPGVIDLEGSVVRFADNIPGRGSEGMGLPTDEQAGRFIDGIRAAQAGRPERAGELVGPMDYRVRTVVDSDTGRTASVFEEQRAADGSWPHGWGMYVVARHPVRRLVVEVPHPVFDIGTAQIGVAAFRKAGAAVLLVPGTHRYANRDGSSDVAHEDRTMFARVNRALVAKGDVVLQPHGFDADREAGEGATNPDSS